MEWLKLADQTFSLKISFVNAFISTQLPFVLFSLIILPRSIGVYEVHSTSRMNVVECKLLEFQGFKLEIYRASLYQPHYILISFYTAFWEQKLGRLYTFLCLFQQFSHPIINRTLICHKARSKNHINCSNFPLYVKEIHAWYFGRPHLTSSQIPLISLSAVLMHLSLF